MFKKYFSNLINKDTRESGQVGLLLILGTLIAATIFAPALIKGFASEAIKVGAWVISLAIAAIGSIAAMLFGLTIDFATWIMGMTMKIPIATPSSTNWAYNVGWVFTRDITNVLFIIILAFIGLATILRIKEYEVSKILPRLIIIALLINFSPVIVGVVVDIFNILTNYFISNILGNNSTWINGLAPLGTFISNATSSLLDPSSSWATMMPQLFGIIAATIFFILGIVVFLVMGLLFMVRVLAFWILLILAPFAFAAYILPSTKKFWSMWWQQLIQWGMIGLTTSFFLYLSFHLLVGASQTFDSSDLKSAFMSSGNIQGSLAGLLAAILPFGVALTFMLIGIMLGLSSGAAGANQVINFSKSLPKRFSRTRGGQRMLSKTLSGTQKVTGATASAMRRLDERVKKIPIIGRPVSTVTTGAFRGMTGGLNRKVIEEAAKTRKVAPPKGWAQMTKEDKEEFLGDLPDDDMLVLASSMKTDGSLAKVSEGFRNKITDTANKFATSKDGHYRKEATDVLDVFSDKITAEARIGLEPTVKDKHEMEVKINKIAGEFKMDVEMQPIINEEANNLLASGIAKTTVAAQERAARNVAARYLHFSGLKQNDIKDAATSTIKSAIAARSFRDMTPGHLQAVQNNFKAEVANDVMQKTFGQMVDGKTEEQAQQIVNDYYDGITRDASGGVRNTDASLAARHRRLLKWAADTPAGREYNIPLGKYLTDPNNMPTTTYKRFEDRKRIEEIIATLPAKEKPLENFYNLHTKATKHLAEMENAQRRIDGLRQRGQPTGYWETKRDRGLAEYNRIVSHDPNNPRIDNIETQWETIIKPDPAMRRTWEEIERLRNPGGRRRNQRPYNPPPAIRPKPPRPAGGGGSGLSGGGSGLSGGGSGLSGGGSQQRNQAPTPTPTPTPTSPPPSPSNASPGYWRQMGDNETLTEPNRIVNMNFGGKKWVWESQGAPDIDDPLRPIYDKVLEKKSLEWLKKDRNFQHDYSGQISKNGYLLDNNGRETNLKPSMAVPPSGWGKVEPDAIREFYEYEKKGLGPEELGTVAVAGALNEIRRQNNRSSKKNSQTKTKKQKRSRT